MNGQLFLLVGREAYGRGAGHWTAFCAPLQRDSSAVQTTVDVAVDACFKSTLGLLCDALTLRESLTALAQPLHVPGGGLYYLLPVPFDPRVCRTFQSVRQIVSAVARPDAGVSDLQFLQMDALAWVPLFSDVYHVRFHTHFWADLHRVRRVLGAMSAPVSASAARAGALPLPLPTPSTPMPAPTPPPPHSFFTPSGQPPLPPLPGA